MAHGVKKINEWIMKDGRTINITTNIDPNKLEGGTQFINPSTGLLNYVKIDGTGSKLWTKFDPVVIFNPQSIVTSLIKDLNVTTAKIAERNVTTTKIALKNVTNQEIGDQEVYTKNIKDSNVTNIKIANGAVDHNKIDKYEVWTENLAEPCVNGDKIYAETIMDVHIVRDNLTNRVIAPKTIRNNEIENLTIIEDLLATNSVTTNKIKDSNVTGAKIAVDSIANSHLKKDSVTTVKILDGNVTNTKIENLDGSKLWDVSIADGKLANGSVITRTIRDGNVTYDKLDANLKDLSDRAIRVEKEVIVGSERHPDTAWVKGNLLVRMPAGGNAAFNITGNITATGNVTAAKCFNPVFADLAEAYVPTEKIEAGDPVCLSLDGNLKVEKLTDANSNRFLGFVSDEYATVFGASPEELRFGKKIAVTLVGRIKIKAPREEAKIGDYVYISNGCVKFFESRTATAIGRVLENKSKADGYVLCQLWP